MANESFVTIYPKLLLYMFDERMCG